MGTLIQRIKDWLHERRIKRLWKEFSSLYTHSFGRYDEFRNALAARSPQQIERMKRKSNVA